MKMLSNLQYCIVKTEKIFYNIKGKFAAQSCRIKGEIYMKLIIGIVNSDDSSYLISEITRASFQATKLSTSGGFLKAGNVTVLVGVEDNKVDDVISIFSDCCSRRTQMVPTTPPFIGEEFISTAPVEITIGGATIFVVDVDKFIKL